MGERKVLNKYYPPDFDPELLPRNKKPRDKQIEVRIMIPFTLCCNECKEFSYRGKKFNSKKEIAQDINYLGLSIHRFFIKCPRCASQIVFRTDPERADYMMESGATRTYEVWNDHRGEEEEGNSDDDAMKALEARTQDSKMEMEILDALDDTKAMNKRKLNVDVAKMIGNMRDKEAQSEKDKIELGDEEEDMVEATEFRSSSRRIDEDEEERRKKERADIMAASRAAAAGAGAGGAAGGAPKRLAGLTVKRKQPEDDADGKDSSKAAKVDPDKEAAPVVTLGSMLGGYSDSGSGSASD